MLGFVNISYVPYGLDVDYIVLFNDKEWNHH